MQGVNGTEVEPEREAVRCALCGSDKTVTKYRIRAERLRFSRLWVGSHVLQAKGTETIVACKSCGLVYVSPRLVAHPDLRTYSVEEELSYFDSTRDMRRRAYQQLLTQIPGWLGSRPRTLFDFGCGDGVLLQVAQEAGIESVGLEVSEPLQDLVRQRLGQAALVSNELSELPIGTFDVVAVLNVIEHLRHPDQTLQTVARLLRPDGILLVHTINFGGLPARLAGVKWHQIEPFSHFYYFTERTLTEMLRRNGFVPNERFGLFTSAGLKDVLQRQLYSWRIYLDNGLGIVARRG